MSSVVCILLLRIVIISNQHSNNWFQHMGPQMIWEAAWNELENAWASGLSF